MITKQSFTVINCSEIIFSIESCYAHSSIIQIIVHQDTDFERPVLETKCFGHAIKRKTSAGWEWAGDRQIPGSREQTEIDRSSEATL